MDSVSAELVRAPWERSEQITTIGIGDKAWMKTSLTPEEQADMTRDMETAQQVMKGGGGGGGVAVAAALAAIIAGAAIASGGGGGSGGGTSGGKGLPDLVPDSGGGGCRFDDKGNVLLAVRNQGQGNAADSVTRVDFEGGDSALTRRSAAPTAQELATPALRPGAASVLTFSSRLLRSLRLRITVDASGRVRESNEGNNTAVISCPAPVG